MSDARGYRRSADLIKERDARIEELEQENARLRKEVAYLMRAESTLNRMAANYAPINVLLYEWIHDEPEEVKG